jgi:hypothetical protein
MAQRAFFRFSVDEASVQQFFSHAEEHFKNYDQLMAQHDQKIEELADQLARRQKPAAKPAIGARPDSRIEGIQSAVGLLECERTRDDFGGRLALKVRGLG